MSSLHHCLFTINKQKITAINSRNSRCYLVLSSLGIWLFITKRHRHKHESQVIVIIWTLYEFIKDTSRKEKPSETSLKSILNGLIPLSFFQWPYKILVAPMTSRFVNAIRIPPKIGTLANQYNILRGCNHWMSRIQHLRVNNSSAWSTFTYFIPLDKFTKSVFRFPKLAMTEERIRIRINGWSKKEMLH